MWTLSKREIILNLVQLPEQCGLVSAIGFGP